MKTTALQFVESIASMTTYISGKHYSGSYKKLSIPVIEYNELLEAAKVFDKENNSDKNHVL